MNDTHTESLPKPVEPAQATGIARRRLLRAGLAAGPVVLALSGRSAMAAAGDPCDKYLSPAAWRSLAPQGVCQKNSHTVTPNTRGKSPDEWRLFLPANTGTGTISFNSVFVSSSNSRQVRQILQNGTNARNILFSAAYLNVNEIPGYAMQLTELLALFGGTLAGKSVSDAEAEAFLKQTWGV